MDLHADHEFQVGELSMHRTLMSPNFSQQDNTTLTIMDGLASRSVSRNNSRANSISSLTGPFNNLEDHDDDPIDEATNAAQEAAFFHTNVNVNALSAVNNTTVVAASNHPSMDPFNDIHRTPNQKQVHRDYKNQSHRRKRARGLQPRGIFADDDEEEVNTYEMVPGPDHSQNESKAAAGGGIGPQMGQMGFMAMANTGNINPNGTQLPQLLNPFVSPSSPIHFQPTAQIQLNNIPARARIEEFVSDRKAMFGFRSNQDYNLKTHLSQTLQRKLPSLNLTRPTVNQNNVIVGTENADGSQNYLLHIDSTVCTTSPALGFNPIVQHYEVPAPVLQTLWSDPSTFICAMGTESNSRVQLYHAGRDGLRTNTAAPLCELTTGIRDMASQSNTLLIADDAMNLCQVDMNRPGPNQIVDVNHDLSSIKWTEGMNPSATSEAEGKLIMFDPRLGLGKPQVICQRLISKRLYTHEWYSPHNVVLGYQDGMMVEIDVRMPPTRPEQVKSWEDPFVDNIGEIEYNPRSGLFAVSGSTDFSVWRHERNQATLWSHMGTTSNVFINEHVEATYAAFYDNDIVISTSSEGNLGVYLQGANQGF